MNDEVHPRLLPDLPDRPDLSDLPQLDAAHFQRPDRERLRPPAKTLPRPVASKAPFVKTDRRILFALWGRR